MGDVDFTQVLLICPSLNIFTIIFFYLLYVLPCYKHILIQYIALWVFVSKGSLCGDRVITLVYSDAVIMSLFLMQELKILWYSVSCLLI